MISALALLVVAQSSQFGQPHISAVPSKVAVLQNVQIFDYDRLVYQGSVDVNPALDRIRRGEKLNHRNDGTFYRNYERKLPNTTDREYYREFVYTQPQLRFPGPARVVIGKNGAVFFTGDHYKSFIKVTK